MGVPGQGGKPQHLSQKAGRHWDAYGDRKHVELRKTVPETRSSFQSPGYTTNKYTHRPKIDVTVPPRIRLPSFPGFPPWQLQETSNPSTRFRRAGYIPLFEISSSACWKPLWPPWYMYARQGQGLTHGLPLSCPVLSCPGVAEWGRLAGSGVLFQCRGLPSETNGRGLMLLATGISKSWFGFALAVN